MDSDQVTRLKDDLRRVLNQLGEDCEYWARGSDVKTRDVVLLVERGDPPGQVPGAAGSHTAPLLVHAVNDAEDGISATEVDCGGDRIKVALREGGTPELRRIVRRIGEDPAELVLELA